LQCVSSAEIDAVVVATADDTHHGIVAACIARGSYVLCEKPLTTSAKQSMQLAEAERCHGRRIVQLGYMRRYDSGYRRTYDALRSGRIGEPVMISQRHRNPLAINDFDVRKLIVNSASHEIDLFRWLTREEITEVSATAKASADKSALTVLLTLKSQSGILGVVELSRGPGLHYDIGCDVLAGRGTLNLACSEPTADPGRGSWIERFDDAYEAQDADWLAAVRAESITGPSLYDGYAANAVAEAALCALDEGGGRPVHQTRASILGCREGAT
ncbi:MAG: Gfo/Idh/MocA family protein, partial [Mycobacterium sp.]